MVGLFEIDNLSVQHILVKSITEGCKFHVEMSTNISTKIDTPCVQILW